MGQEVCFFLIVEHCQKFLSVFRGTLTEVIFTPQSSRHLTFVRRTISFWSVCLYKTGRHALPWVRPLCQGRNRICVPHSLALALGDPFILHPWCLCWCFTCRKTLMPFCLQCLGQLWGFQQLCSILSTAIQRGAAKIQELANTSFTPKDLTFIGFNRLFSQGRKGSPILGM